MGQPTGATTYTSYEEMEEKKVDVVSNPVVTAAPKDAIGINGDVILGDKIIGSAEVDANAISAEHEAAGTNCCGKCYGECDQSQAQAVDGKDKE